MIHTWLILCGLCALYAPVTQGARLTGPASLVGLGPDPLVKILSYIKPADVPLLSKVVNQAFNLRMSYVLFDAVEKNSPKRILKLLDKKVSAHVTNNAGFTPLEVAVQHGYFDCVKALMPHYSTSFLAKVLNWSPPHCAVHDCNLAAIQRMGHPEQINSQDKFNMTPLDWALENPHNHEIVQALMKHGARFNKTDPTTWTLHDAARKGNSSMVAYLLCSGSDPNKTDEYGQTPLHRAAWNGHSDVVTLLINNGAPVNDKDNYEQTPLHFAAIGGHYEVAEELLKLGADANARSTSGWTPLHCAESRGNHKIAELLRIKGALDVEDDYGHTPAYFATHNTSSILDPNTGIVLLVGCDPTSRTHSGQSGTAKIGGSAVDPPEEVLLCNAAQYGHLKIVELFLEQGVDPNSARLDGLAPLHIAARAGNMKIVKLLIKNNANPNAVTPDGETPLSFATAGNHIGTAKLLLDNHADPNVPVGDGTTLLVRAASAGQWDIVELLLAHGASATGTDGSGMTALHAVALAGKIRIAALLLANGADPNAAEVENEWTPLHVAARKGDCPMVELFLRFGANAAAVTLQGKTPRSFAVHGGHQNIVELLDSAAMAV